MLRLGKPKPTADGSKLCLRVCPYWHRLLGRNRSHLLGRGTFELLELPRSGRTHSVAFALLATPFRHCIYECRIQFGQSVLRSITCTIKDNPHRPHTVGELFVGERIEVSG